MGKEARTQECGLYSTLKLPRSHPPTSHTQAERQKVYATESTHISMAERPWSIALHTACGWGRPTAEDHGGEALNPKDEIALADPAYAQTISKHETTKA
jgi:hypothetical protein